MLKIFLPFIAQYAIVISFAEAPGAGGEKFSLLLLLNTQ